MQTFYLFTFVSKLGEGVLGGFCGSALWNKLVCSLHFKHKLKMLSHVYDSQL